MGIDAEQLSVLESSNNKGYGRLPIPVARDEEITSLLHRLREPEALGLINSQHSDVLGAYARRMASLAVRERSREVLQDGLLAVRLALGVGDRREGLDALSLLYRAAELIGSDPGEEFSVAARGAPLPVSRELTSFLNRSDENKSIAAFRYVEGVDDDGFRFQHEW